ncbi:cytochrome c maturation protein CcmE [Pseudooceanicola sp. CBS1P-1]|uniref:Cytochrome c-type biogenesis protein CcmE n=1 Tax=Pseudooceanicola albus TaxID=2692189 RepID=A0A6L7GBI5_9RHOB|nr:MULTISPECIES: cytochrome c maturation protein CcmE [Pseudooceanicola]MBT9384459.1 cytochrome c maturation protein CcmE [Pseudooceanicola endophyticus]MXN20640.1 cytochrome c maturation protein CcmE [Pseudooceanicola albus]
MKGLKKKRRIQLIVVAFAALAIATGLIGYSLRGGINYFRSPSQVLAENPSPNETFRLGGLVEEGTLDREQGETVHFKVTDGGATIPVVYTGILPDLFAEKQGMIGTGKYVNGVFHATEILAKHDENYMPKELKDALKEQGVYEGADKKS